MGKLLLALILIMFLSPICTLAESTVGSLNAKIASIETVVDEYQVLILDLNSQGAYASDSIRLLSDMKDLIWQAKILIVEGNINEADAKLEAAKVIGPRITMDVSFSLKINRGRLAIEEGSLLVEKARNEGQNVKVIQAYLDEANRLFIESKNSYASKNYDSIDSKINEISSLVEKISSSTDELKANPTQTPTTGFALSFPNIDWVGAYWWIPVVVVVGVLILRFRKGEKKLSKVSRLEIINNRMR